MGLETLPPELLETTLLLLDEQTLLLAQRVCRGWWNCIRQSVAIQQALFFQPTRSSHTSRRRNPLLETHFPYWFPADDRSSVRTAHGAKDMQQFLERKSTYLRPDASWRRMLVQQPPVYSLGWTELDGTELGIVLAKRWYIPLDPEDGGLRMKTLYDLLFSTSEEEKYSFFRICWSGHVSSLPPLYPHPGPDPDPDRNMPISLGELDHERLEDKDRYLRLLKDALAASDIVLETWNSPSLPPSQWMKFGDDQWTWSLMENLQAPVQQRDVENLCKAIELKDKVFWTTFVETSCGPYPLSLEDDADL
ncbi:uncharacterized protein N7459_004804 [Penicillium hispanicum]|uniref:uncharacterized protein n=1 Tax=Penicillium hispanicum TaxID=1080232 RepID=UPI0025407260|nr:uncharacterized protein N7459_004804 [Penicillium hispanicum]KAJ5585004.1 hypothetical protein N7459_004804 [Penicillium hispanicum]